MKTVLQFTSSHDEHTMVATCWMPEKPKAIVQIFHGMSEHRGRYEEFCEFLYEHDLLVVIADHRGHGDSVSEQIPQGYFAEEDGWLINLKDQHAISRQIRNGHEDLPFYLFGHSMGSLYARSYLKRYENELNGLIVCGTPAPQKLAKLGYHLSQFMAKRKGSKTKLPLMDKLSFGAFNKGVKNPKTSFDWISTNPENVKEYLRDDKSGFIFTTKGYADLMWGMQDVYQSKDWTVQNPDLPILFISGEEDAASLPPDGFGKSVASLKEKGYRNITQRQFVGMRHEILNENHHEMVYDTVWEFLQSCMDKATSRQAETSSQLNANDEPKDTAEST